MLLFYKLYKKPKIYVIKFLIKTDILGQLQTGESKINMFSVDQKRTTLADVSTKYSSRLQGYKVKV